MTQRIFVKCCINCFGEGVIKSPNPNMDGEYEDCPHCKGTGKILKNNIKKEG